MPEQRQRYKPPGVPIEADTPGFNEWGVPWHACAGHRHDEHYWAWVHWKNRVDLTERAPMK